MTVQINRVAMVLLVRTESMSTFVNVLQDGVD